MTDPSNAFNVRLDPTKIRPSNLILLAAAPFIVVLFASSPKYLRSLKAIVGTGPDAPDLLAGFVLLVVVFASGFLAARRWTAGDAAAPWLVASARLAVPIHAFGIPLMIAFPPVTDPFVHSDFLDWLDPVSSELIDRSTRPWAPHAHALATASEWFRTGLAAYGALYVAAGVTAATAAGRVRVRVRVLGIRAFTVISGAGLLYLAFIAHWGFATTIAVTLRATVYAYALAAALGLLWTGMRNLRRARTTIPIHAGVGVALLAAAAFLWSRPPVEYVMIGSTDARIAIVKGTPQAVVDQLRFGESGSGDHAQVRIRSAPDVATALALIESDANVSGAFVPGAAHDGRHPVLRAVRFLPDGVRTPALALTVAGLLLAILTFGAALHRLHPLAVGAEFFVDTIRGIPMLVIILYIGLPLSGAIKDATDGGIDLTNFTRGVVAIAVGYSAYMAEIFRAGIEAVPAGQVEAARSLGLSRWQAARLIVLPQALRIVVPPLGNELIAMIKDTSLLSILSVRDVTQATREFQSASFLPFAPFNTAAIVYVVLTLACASFLKWVERRFDRNRDPRSMPAP